VSLSETHRRQHELFNSRDFGGFDEFMREDLVYESVPQGRVIKGREEFKGFLGEWTSAFPDVRIEDGTYLEGPGFTVAQVRVRGRNDGPFGPLPASGRRVDFPAWDVQQYDDQGRLLSASVLFDQVTLLTQLGHLQLPG
jgi:steroid delta-isomerase-like uncharacterized protein